MQKTLFIDRLQHKELCKNNLMLTYNTVFTMGKCSEVSSHSTGFQLRTTPAFKEHLEDNRDEITHAKIISHSTKALGDKGLVSFLTAASLYHKLKGKNYVFTKGLTSILKTTKADIPLKYLPKQFSGYFEIPSLYDHEGSPFLGVFINIFEESIQFSGFTHENSIPIVWLHLDMDRSKTLRQIIEEKETPFETMKPDPNAKDGLARGHIENKYHSFQHVMGNALAFVCNPEFELQEERNEFSKKKSKLSIQMKVAARANFIVVGKEYHGRTFHVDEAAVSGHWRWQPCGEGRSQIKLVFIKPHVRKYQTKGNK